MKKVVHNLKGSLRTTLLILVSTSMLVLTGCQSTGNTVQTGPMSVGPGSYSPLGTQTESYTYNSDIFLDVAIPVFDPGLPMNRKGEIDYDEVDDEGLWPQLRRAEAKRFAIQVQKTLKNTEVFSAVSVTPTPNTSADLFLLGKILKSNAEFVELQVTWIDSTGVVWDTKEFEHQVSKGFFRDARNKDRNPYEPVFKHIANHTYSLLMKKSDTSKQAIKNTSDIRYAQSYSPESFNKYVTQKVKKQRGNEYYRFNLTGMPSVDDPMFARIQAIRSQEQMFVERLQDQYGLFDENTVDTYRVWQRETLPDAIKAREAKSAAAMKAVGSLLFTALAGSTGSDTVAAVSAIGAIYTAKSAFDSVGEMKFYKESLDEMGENLDISLSPQVMNIDDKTIELTGTAGEQYDQWRAHLHKIFNLEQGFPASTM